MSVFGQPRIAGGEIFYRGEAIKPEIDPLYRQQRHRPGPGRAAHLSRYDRREENLLMGTIAIGNRYQAEDKARMYQLFPGWKSGGDSGR